MSDHNEKLRLYWNDHSKKYSSSRAQDNLPIISTLGNLVKLRSSKSILDVGCGPGVGLKYIYHLLQHNASIYGLDFSSSMVNICKDTFSTYRDFISNPNNSFEIINGSCIEVDSKCDKGIAVKVIEGNCESLPFKDEQFDTYISSLCLQITHDRIKAFKEMYRVLKMKGRFAFAVWGKKEDTTCRPIEMTCERMGLKIESFFNFDCGKDPIKILSELKEIGFSHVKYEYFNQLRDEVETPEEYYNTLYPKDVKEQMEVIMKEDPQRGKEIDDAIKKDLYEMYEKGKTPVMSILIVYGTK